MILLIKSHSLVGGYQRFEVNQLPQSSWQYYANDVCSSLRDVGNQYTESQSREYALAFLSLFSYFLLSYLCLYFLAVPFSRTLKSSIVTRQIQQLLH